MSLLAASNSPNGRDLTKMLFLSTPTTVKIQCVTSWVHLSRIKLVNLDTLQEFEDPHSSHTYESTPSSKSPQNPEFPGQSENSRWMSEPLKDLQLLFQKDKKKKKKKTTFLDPRLSIHDYYLLPTNIPTHL